MDSLCVGIPPSIDCDGGTGRQVIADPRDNPFPGCPYSAGVGDILRTVGAIRSERWAASDRSRWAAYVRIRIESALCEINGHYEAFRRFRMKAFYWLRTATTANLGHDPRNSRRVEHFLFVLPICETVKSCLKVHPESIPLR